MVTFAWDKVERAPRNSLKDNPELALEIEQKIRSSAVTASSVSMMIDPS